MRKDISSLQKFTKFLYICLYTRFVAAAALSLVAALARKVLDIKLSEDYANDTEPVVSSEIQ